MFRKINKLDVCDNMKFQAKIQFAVYQYNNTITN